MKRWWRGAVIAVIAATGACDSDALLGSAPRVDNVAIFDEVWRAFDLHYSYFGIRNVDWNASREYYRPRAIAAATDPELASVIGTMMRDLRDVHVVLTATEEIGAFRYTPTDNARRTYFDETRIVQEYVQNVQETSGGNIRFGYLDTDVGYVAIETFRGRDWSGEIDEALDALDVYALVIDVRDNRGGDNEIATAIAGRFADRERTYGYVRLRDGPRHNDFTDYIPERVRPIGRRFRGTVLVLGNRETMSAAEDFILAMRSIPGVRIVGDTTAGASGGPIVRELPNGWTFQLSEWIAYDANRRPFEGTGLAPDIAVGATAQDGDTDVALDVARGLARASVRR